MKNLNIDLSDYHFLITGASGFIGSYLSEEFYKLGAKLSLIDKKFVENHWSFNTEINNLNKYECNILDKKKLDECIKTSFSEIGKVDAILSLAAIDHKVTSEFKSEQKYLSDLSKEQSLFEYELSIHGSINVVDLCTRKLDKRDKLSVVLVGSDLSIIAPYQDLYRSSFGKYSEKPFSYSTVKHALLGLTKYLASYWEDKDIRVNLLCPSGVNNESMPKAFKNKLMKLNPLSRICEIEELLGPSIFLLTEMSTFYNGQTLIIDGGRTIW